MYTQKKQNQNKRNSGKARVSPGLTTEQEQGLGWVVSFKDGLKVSLPPYPGSQLFRIFKDVSHSLRLGKMQPETSKGSHPGYWQSPQTRLRASRFQPEVPPRSLVP